MTDKVAVVSIERMAEDLMGAWLQLKHRENAPKYEHRLELDWGAQVKLTLRFVPGQTTLPCTDGAAVAGQS